MKHVDLVQKFLGTPHLTDKIFSLLDRKSLVCAQQVSVSWRMATRPLLKRKIKNKVRKHVIQLIDSHAANCCEGRPDKKLRYATCKILKHLFNKNDSTLRQLAANTLIEELPRAIKAYKVCDNQAAFSHWEESILDKIWNTNWKEDADNLKFVLNRLNFLLLRPFSSLKLVTSLKKISLPELDLKSGLVLEDSCSTALNFTIPFSRDHVCATDNILLLLFNSDSELRTLTAHSLVHFLQSPVYNHLHEVNNQKQFEMLIIQLKKISDILEKQWLDDGRGCEYPKLANLLPFRSQLRQLFLSFSINCYHFHSSASTSKV